MGKPKEGGASGLNCSLDGGLKARRGGKGGEDSRRA
jgi:hypothetical protein